MAAPHGPNASQHALGRSLVAQPLAGDDPGLHGAARERLEDHQLGQDLGVGPAQEGVVQVDLWQPVLLLSSWSPAPVWRIVRPPSNTLLAPAPVGEVRRLVRLALGPRRRAW